MTVGELTQLLQRHPRDMRVVVNGYEDGYDDLTPEQLSVIEITLHTGKHWWEGQHGAPNQPNDAQVVKALALRRVSNLSTPSSTVARATQRPGRRNTRQG